MGGNALQNTETRRYNRDEYMKLESEVCRSLEISVSKFPR
jgi:hypothetical protein